MKRVKEKRIKRHRRAERARAKPRGAADRSRLSVFHSNRYLWAQVIDDASGRTLASASDREVSHSGKRPKAKSLSRRERAGWVGERIAERREERKEKRAERRAENYWYWMYISVGLSCASWAVASR